MVYFLLTCLNTSGVFDCQIVKCNNISCQEALEYSTVNIERTRYLNLPFLSAYGLASWSSIDFHGSGYGYTCQI